VILYSAEPLRGGLEVLPQNWESKIIKGVNLGRGPWLWTQLGLTLEMIKNRPDILFVPSHAIPLIHPKRTYTTIHDIGFEVFPESYRFLALLYHRFSARCALRSAERIFVPSEFTKQELIKYYKADSKKIIVTPLGFDPEKYHPNQNVIPNSFRDLEPYVLFIGRIEKKKNVKRLIEAFLALKKELSSRPERSEAEGSLKLVLVGTPGFGYDEIKAASGSTDIIFTGYMPTADLPGILAGASVYALPSLYEGFGIPILEAFASGVPVLTSTTASMPEVAGDAACLVNPELVEEIKSALQKLTENEAYRQDLISRGFLRIKDFSWENTAKITLKSIIHNI
jgi:glycosyltransferase involved in cell wall biosynthesis